MNRPWDQPDFPGKRMTLEEDYPVKRSPLNFKTIMFDGQDLDIVVGEGFPSTVGLVDDLGNMVAIIETDKVPCV